MPIIQLGMEPVAIDCDPTTLNVMSWTLLERLREVELSALFITNALGFAGDLWKIREICEERGILLLEDNCESFGTELHAGRTGNFGICASFSFYVAHHMSTIEGGMVCTGDQMLGEMLRIVRANGWDRNLTSVQQARRRAQSGIRDDFEAKYTFYDLGFNLRPTEITGFIGLQQLNYVAETFEKRERNYLRLSKAAAKNVDFLPLERQHIRLLSNFAYPIVCRSSIDRRRYVDRFVEAGVEVRPLIAGNMQRQPFYKKYVSKIYSTSGADQVHDAAFYVGNYPELTDGDLEVMARCLAP